MDFVGLTAGTARDVYQWDIGRCVATCDAFIAICDFPSLGLGYELATAVEKLRKPTLALAQNDAKISRLILGIESPHYRFTRYAMTTEIPKIIEEFLAGNSSAL